MRGLVSTRARAVRHARECFGRDGIHTRETRFQQLQALRSCLPQLTDELRDEHHLPTSGVTALLPWSAVQLTMPGGFLWGLVKGTNTPILINLFGNPPLTDANLAIFARVRQGKSFLLKRITRRLLAVHGAGTEAAEDGRGTRCVVVDTEAKQEYRPLCQDVGGQYIRPGPGSPVPHQSVRLAAIRPERMTICAIRCATTSPAWSGYWSCCSRAAGP